MLEKLTEHHCWSIFKQKAFVDGEVPEEIMGMEKRIVEMCQGIPLAATVLGGLLCNKKKHEWQAILTGIPLFHLIKMIMEKIALKKSLNSALIIFNLHTWFFFCLLCKVSKWAWKGPTYLTLDGRRISLSISRCRSNVRCWE